MLLRLSTFRKGKNNPLRYDFLFQNDSTTSVLGIQKREYNRKDFPKDRKLRGECKNTVEVDLTYFIVEFVFFSNDGIKNRGRDFSLGKS